jgi:hypothetical protein
MEMINELSRGKPGISMNDIVKLYPASCGEFNPTDFVPAIAHSILIWPQKGTKSTKIKFQAS